MILILGGNNSSTQMGIIDIMNSFTICDAKHDRNNFGSKIVHQNRSSLVEIYFFCAYFAKAGTVNLYGTPKLDTERIT